ncbi:CD1375 family protein [Lederbergia citrisecunda]|nr:CD1375 family protein [Lederbergia citrisecunda]
MTFTTDSAIAKSYAVLILAGKYTMDDVPNVGNLREIVEQILTS